MYLFDNLSCSFWRRNKYAKNSQGPLNLIIPQNSLKNRFASKVEKTCSWIYRTRKWLPFPYITEHTSKIRLRKITIFQIICVNSKKWIYWTFKKTDLVQKDFVGVCKFYGLKYTSHTLYTACNLRPFWPFCDPQREIEHMKYPLFGFVNFLSVVFFCTKHFAKKIIKV